MIDTQQIREHWVRSSDIEATHPADCWRWHPSCAIAQLCDIIDDRGGSIAAIHCCAHAWLAHAPPDGPERPALLAIIEACERALPELLNSDPLSRGKLD